MAEVHKTQDFKVSADEMWALIGDFHGIHKWVDGVEPSESIEDGKARKMSVPGGAMVERLLGEGDRSYTYSIVEGPLPVTDYTSTLQVLEAGDGACTVDWKGTFEPAEGTPEDTAVMIVNMVYDGGLGALTKRFG